MRAIVAIVFLISLVSICDATDNINVLYPNRREEYTWGNPIRTISYSYFYDSSTFGRNPYSQTGSINDGTVSIPVFYNSAGKTVQQLFGSDDQIYKLGIVQTYRSTEGRKDDAWVFEFKARFQYEGFKNFKLSFYDETTEDFIVSFEKHFSDISNGVYECRWPRDMVSDKTGFDALVSKLKIRETVKFFLEFIDAPEVQETTSNIPETTMTSSLVGSTTVSTSASSSEPVSTSSSVPVSTSSAVPVSTSSSEPISTSSSVPASTSSSVPASTSSSVPVSTSSSVPASTSSSIPASTSSSVPASTSSSVPVSTSVLSSVSPSGLDMNQMQETSYPEKLLGNDDSIPEEEDSTSMPVYAQVLLGIGIYLVGVLVVYVFLKIFRKKPVETTEPESGPITVVVT